MIAHRLSTIYGADEICAMHEGEIVEHGKLLALNGYYKQTLRQATALTRG
ncbi:MAG: hypothetical protein LBP64_05470 [Tannerella sp.]|jgi:ATP-binding cassette subfamily B protein/subfamily B ATP-binding cassette protein MsbA|nr:hypothetical protein [Tannerella sp.]